LLSIGIEINWRKHGSLWQGGRENGEKRYASEEARNAQVRQRGKRGAGHEQKTGDCHWALGSAKEGREGSA
jgi:hypothetical protein